MNKGAQQSLFCSPHFKTDSRRKICVSALGEREITFYHIDLLVSNIKNHKALSQRLWTPKLSSLVNRCPSTH